MVAEPGGEPEVVMVEAVPVAVVREKVPTDQVVAFFDRAFPAVADELERQEIGRVAPAVAIYHGEPTDSVDVAVGFPVQRPVSDAGQVVGSALPGGMVVRAVHVGAYDRLSETYALLRAYAADQGVALSEVVWESYLTEPSPEADPARMLTEVSWLLRG